MAGTESVLYVSTKLEVKIIVLSGGVLKNEEKVSRRTFVKTVVRGAAALGIANTLEPFETFAKETKQRFDFCPERRGEGLRFYYGAVLFMNSQPLESTTLGASAHRDGGQVTPWASQRGGQYCNGEESPSLKLASARSSLFFHRSFIFRRHI